MKITMDLTYTKRVVVDLPSNEQEEVDFVVNRLTPEGEEYDYDVEFEQFLMEEAEKQDPRKPHLCQYDIKHVETDTQYMQRLEKERREKEDIIRQMPF